MGTEENGRKSVHRRSFLKGLAIGSAGLASAPLSTAWAALARSETTKLPTASMPTTWDETADVVVLGYGGSGIVAAIEAADAGARVLALEKSPVSGGCTKISDCNITNPDSLEGMVQYLRATIGQNGVTEAIIQEISRETCKNQEWLTSMGIGFSIGNMIYSEFPDAPGREHMLTGRPTTSKAMDTKATDAKTMDGPPRGAGAHGALLCDSLKEQAERRGVKVLYRAPARDLIQNPQTREIIGVRAEREGKEITVKAGRAVVLCTGPFDFNDEMIRNYLRPYPMKFAGWKFNTGDGIPMATRVGARLWHMNGICGYYCPWFEEGKSGYLTFGSMKPSWIYCDRYGKRFADESRLMEHNFWKNMIEVDHTGLGYSRNPGWIVFDETARKAGSMAQSYTAWLPEELGGAPAFSNDNSAEIAKGWIIKGDTLGMLAEKTGMVEENLKSELEAIQRAVADGVPDRFGRSPKGTLGKLGPWDNGPYYAMRVYVGAISTMGGPERNEKGQVVGYDGKPIPRLYEAGALGSIWGDHYGPAGGNVGISVLAGGRIAGRYAAAEKPWG